MFGADVATHAFWPLEGSHGEEGQIRDNMDYLFPTFTYQKPWTRLPGEESGTASGDFILIAEFSEQEGPRPVITIPKDGGRTFDQNDFCVKILAVDHQSSVIEGCHMTEDAQVVMADTEKGVHAFVHHTVLNDIEARGYVRPFCISYVMSDPGKLMACYQDISTQMKKVSRLLKYGNRLVFMRDLEKYLEDLDYTKANLLFQSQSRSGVTGPGQGDNNLLNALNTIRHSMEEVKEIISNLKPLLNDRELEERFQSLEYSLRSTHHDSRDGESSSLQDFPTHHVDNPAYERGGSYTESLSPEFSLFSKSKNLKPKLLDVSGIRGKRRFDHALRGLHELCSWGAREGLQRLRILREFFKRDYSALQVDQTDYSVLGPDCGVLSFGSDFIGANFLTAKSSDHHRCCTRKHSHNQRQHMHSLGSLESFKSLSSSFNSFLEDEEDMMYSVPSSLIDTTGTLDMRLAASEDYVSKELPESGPGDSPVMFTYDTAFPGDVAAELESTVTDTLSRRSTETVTSGGGSHIVDGGGGTTLTHNADNCGNCCSQCDSTVTRDIKDCSSTTDVSDFDNIDIDRDLKCTAKGCGCIHHPPALSSEPKHNCSPPNQQPETTIANNDFNTKTNQMSVHTIHLASTLNSEYVRNSIEFRKVNLDNSPVEDVKEHCDSRHILDKNLELDNAGILCNLLDGNDITDVCDSVVDKCDLGLPAQCVACPTSHTVNMCNISPPVSDTHGASGPANRPSDIELPNNITAVQSNAVDNVTANLDNLDLQDEHLIKPKPLTANQNPCPEHLKLKCLPVMFGKTINDDQLSVFSESRQSSMNSLDEEHRQVRSRRKWRLKDILQETSDQQEIEASLQKVLCGFNNLQHIVYSLLSGRPVVVIGTKKHEVMIREIIQAFNVFVPFLKGCEPVSFVCMLKQLRVVDIHKFQLRGIIRSERRSLDYVIPHSIRRYITLLDVEKLLIHCQPYQGSMLNFIGSVYYRRKVFKSEQALTTYIHLCLIDISTKAFNFYHSVMMDNNLAFSGASMIRKCAMLELTAEKFLNKAGLLNSDCRIIKHLAEIVKVQQIDQEFTSKDCPAYPFSVSYQTVQTYRC